MTVTYTGKVYKSGCLGVFWRLLFTSWRGSLAKLLWPDCALYLVYYFLISLIYRLALDNEQKRTFENIATYVKGNMALVPISFMLGFYVNLIYSRWWNQYQAIPWPDNLACEVSAYIHGMDERGRTIRRTIMRYINLAEIICFSSICSRVKKRFPSTSHLVDAGIMTEAEQEILENIEPKNVCKYWVPIVWASAVVECGRRENRIKSAYAQEALIRRITDFRTGLGTLLGYNTMCVPLLYSQTVTIGVYSYFVASGIGNQWLDPAMKYPFNGIDLYFPFFAFLQFLFYMGWLRAAEVMINPFGEDDDDFEINALIDRNLTISYTIVDEMHDQHPDLVRDAFWDMAPEIPHTIASEKIPEDTNQFVGAAEHLEVQPKQAIYGPVCWIDVKRGQADPDDGSKNNLFVRLTKRLRGTKRSTSKRQRTPMTTSSSVRHRQPSKKMETWKRPLTWLHVHPTDDTDTDNDIAGAPLPLLQDNGDLETTTGTARLESPKQLDDDDQKRDDNDVV